MNQTLPIRILFNDPLSEERIHVKYVPTRFKKIPYIEKRIEERWKRLVKEAKEKNLVLFDGPLVRLEGFSLKSDLIFYINSTSFRETMGVRPAADIFKQYGMDFIPNALSTFSIVVTSDNKIPLLLRSSTADFNDTWILPCGFVDEKEDHSNPCQTSRRNTIIDLSLEKSTLKIQTFIGLYEYPDIAETTACFSVEVNTDSQFILLRDEQSHAKRLHSKILFINHSLESIHQLLFEKRSDLHPGAQAALLLYTKYKWGDPQTITCEL